MRNLPHILCSTFPPGVTMPRPPPDAQAGDTILEANEPAPDRDQEFAPHNGIGFTPLRPRITHRL